MPSKNWKMPKTFKKFRYEIQLTFQMISKKNTIINVKLFLCTLWILQICITVGVTVRKFSTKLSSDECSPKPTLPHILQLDRVNGGEQSLLRILILFNATHSCAFVRQKTKNKKTDGSLTVLDLLVMHALGSSMKKPDRWDATSWTCNYSNTQLLEHGDYISSCSPGSSCCVVLFHYCGKIMESVNM